MKSSHICLFDNPTSFSYYFSDYLIKKEISVITISYNLNDLKTFFDSIYNTTYLLKDKNNYYSSYKYGKCTIFIASVFQAKWLIKNKNISIILVYEPNKFPYYVLDEIYGLEQ